MGVSIHEEVNESYAAGYNMELNDFSLSLVGR